MTDWCIFYADGSAFISSAGKPEEAPTHGVISIVQKLSNHVQVLHQADLYWWRDGMWWAGDVLGFVDQAGVFGATWVKQGRTVKSEVYSEIIGKAITLKEKWDS